MKASEVRLVMLQLLREVSPQALPEAMWKTLLNARVRPAVGAADFDDNVVWLQGRRFIVPMEGELGDDEPRWLLTEAGEAQLLKR